jgi:hypothetical protein
VLLRSPLRAELRHRKLPELERRLEAEEERLAAVQGRRKPAEREGRQLKLQRPRRSEGLALSHRGVEGDT